MLLGSLIMLSIASSKPFEGVASTMRPCQLGQNYCGGSIPKQVPLVKPKEPKMESEKETPAGLWLIVAFVVFMLCLLCSL